MVEKLSDKLKFQASKGWIAGNNPDELYNIAKEVVVLEDKLERSEQLNIRLAVKLGKKAIEHQTLEDELAALKKFKESMSGLSTTLDEAHRDLQEIAQSVREITAENRSLRDQLKRQSIPS